MYLAILDEQLHELAMSRIILYDVPFHMSPGRNEGEQCSFVNAVPIVSSRLQVVGGRAAALGLCEELDTVPFAVIPLGQSRNIDVGGSLYIAPGQLVVAVSDIRPWRKQLYAEPDPKPKPEPRIRLRSKS